MNTPVITRYLIETTKITKASPKWGLRTSIPRPIVNMLSLSEGQVLNWSLTTINGKDYITLTTESNKSKT